MTLPIFRLRRPVERIGGPFPHARPSRGLLAPLKSLLAAIEVRS